MIVAFTAHTHLLSVTGDPESTGFTPGRRQSKTLIVSPNVDQKSFETEFSIAICRRLATNCNRKHCFYRFLIRVRRLLRAFSIAAYQVWVKCT